MGKIKYLLAVMMVVAVSFPNNLLCTQKSLPQVPITYPGDTNETINKRAQWIEGAKKEGTVVWWGTRHPREADLISAEFNKIYPFIKVSYWRGKGEEVAVKLEAEQARARSSVDVILGGEPYNYPRWRKMGIMEKMTDIIPGIENWNKGMYSKYGDWVQPGNSPKVIQYNTNLTSAAESPKSWEDLLNPKWKNQIGLQTDMNMWIILALGEGGWGLEKTEEFLQKIKQQNPVWVGGGPAGHTLLIAGDFKIMGDSDLRDFLYMKDKNPPVDWVRCNPIPVSGSSFTLQKKAQDPNAARLFIEWMLSPKGLAVYEKVTKLGSVSPNAGTVMAKTLAGLHVVYRTEDVALKSNQLGLSERFGKILGITPK